MSKTRKKAKAGKAKTKTAKRTVAKKTTKTKAAKKSTAGKKLKTSTAARKTTRTTSRTSARSAKRPVATITGVIRTIPQARTKTAGSSMPPIGTPAPAFELMATDGSQISLEDFRGRANVVLYFYPKDDTPGCTVEACSFRDDYPRFDGADTVVLGVSPDSVTSHDKFTRKFNLPFPLLADEGADVARKYGVWVEKNMYGKKYMGVQRATFLIDKSGQLAAVWPKVSVDGHSAEVLTAVQKLGH